MPSNSYPQRRDFLKTAVAGAAGAVGLGALRFDKVLAQSTGGWSNGMQINPAIDNKRVICCNDPNMLTTLPKDPSFTTTNNAVAAAVVAANLDEMAMQLAQKTTAAEAWSTIFRIGAGKSWASARVAMKTNGIGGTTTNRPKWAIFKKLCDVLVGLGVQPTNIILYDACDDASSYYNAYISLTDSTKIRAAQVSVRAAGMGGFKAVTMTNATAISAAADLVDGNIDILVNVAACKSHNGTGGHYNYGSCTLCMKNHFGTFTSGTEAGHSGNLHVPNSATTPPPPPLALFEINKHAAVLGGNPVRQQLCIVDALLSNGQSGPGGAWDNRTNRLVMGTFAPIVDYFATKKILLDNTVMTDSAMPALGVTNAATILPLFLTSFGYAETDSFQWIEYTPQRLPPIGGNTGSTGGTTASGGTPSTGGSKAGGGTTGSGGTATGGSQVRGGTTSTGGSQASGGTTSAGGSRSPGGTTRTGGSAPTGGTINTGGSQAAGGTPANGGTTANGGTSGNGGTSALPASGGSPTTGGTGGDLGTTGGVATAATSASGGSPTAGATVAGKNSGSGCAVAGADRRATRWGAMLALGAVVAEKLRRLVSGSDRSS
jgi:hypothetical protein